jgi:hypothetical protein
MRDSITSSMDDINLEVSAEERDANEEDISQTSGRMPRRYGISDMFLTVPLFAKYGCRNNICDLIIHINTCMYGNV